MSSLPEENKRNEDFYERFNTVRENSRNSCERTIEYFLEKLKRVDEEMTTINAEHREVLEEISRKNSKISASKNHLKQILQEENAREINKLSRTKESLTAQIREADNMLARLGLIWVGENPSVRELPLESHDFGSHYRPLLVNKPKSREVIPFLGKGYRLGTGSEILVSESPEKMPPSAKLSSYECETKTPPRVVHQGSSGKTDSKVLTERVGSAPVNPIVSRAELVGAKTLEELPMELLVMSRSDRRRALKQMSVQIQKNMNKYSH